MSVCDPNIYTIKKRSDIICMHQDILGSFDRHKCLRHSTLQKYTKTLVKTLLKNPISLKPLCSRMSCCLFTRAPTKVDFSDNSEIIFFLFLTKTYVVSSCDNATERSQHTLLSLNYPHYPFYPQHGKQCCRQCHDHQKIYLHILMFAKVVTSQTRCVCIQGSSQDTALPIT